MNKSSLFTFSLLIALFVGAVNYSPTLQKPFISSLNFIKNIYHSTTEAVHNSIDKHFFQAETIDILREKLQKYESNHLVMQEMASEIHDLYRANDANFSVHPQVELVRGLAYEKLGNFNRIWLDVEEYNGSKIYGLTYKNIVAGIVINKNSKPLALLHNDIKSTYAVYIGDAKAPGIAHGNNEKNIVVNYIPAWYPLHVGDEVVTSGLDRVFFKGLKVGKVLSVSRSEGYQNVVVAPYYQTNEPSYFYMIKEIR